MEWFYANGGAAVGPLSAEEFEDLVRAGVVNDGSLVWASGQKDWLPWGEIAPRTGVCASSGGRFWRSDLVESDGRLVSARPSAPRPVAAPGGASTDVPLGYGGFWIRVLAKLLDGLLLAVVNIITNLLWSMVFFGRMMFSPQLNESSIGSLMAFQGVTFLSNLTIGLIYSWFFLRRYAATPGKMALSLKVVRADGSALSNGLIIGRYFAEMLSSLTLGIGYLLAAFDDQKRALHDRICDTRVVKTE